MQLENMDPNQIAEQWTARVTQQLQRAGIPPAEIEETALVLKIMTRTAAEQMKQDPTFTNPQSGKPFRFDLPKAQQVLDLFVRGVNFTSKRLRQQAMSWEQRRAMLEQLAFEMFMLAKMLVAMHHAPAEEKNELLSSGSNLQEAMKQGCSMMLNRHFGNGNVYSLKHRQF